MRKGTMSDAVTRHRGRGTLAVALSTAAMALGGLPASVGAVASAEPPVRSLGTLGGADSDTVAVDRHVAVGTSDTAPGSQRAFAYDLDGAKVRDLGTLGGSWSIAADVDAGIVVGRSATRRGAIRAFAYDLRRGGMQNLGTLGGASSSASAVDGRVVAGSAALGPHRMHAFAYDLRTDSMRDLGTLGGPSSSAVAVDGDVVVGTSYLPTDSGGAMHSFAYDLGAGSMRDLGTLAGKDTYAVAVSGKVVVGYSYTNVPNSYHAFAYDLSTQTMHDLGTLGGLQSAATDVDGDTVVGWSLLGDNTYHAFAYDMSTGAMQDLGTPGDAPGSLAVAVDGDLVVGMYGWGSRTQLEQEDGGAGFAYDLRTGTFRRLPPAPGSDTSVARAVDGGTVVGRVNTFRADEIQQTMVLHDAQAAAWNLGIGFDTVIVKVSEAAGTRRLVVRRGGDTTSAATVSYARQSGTATPGTDFLLQAGELTFGPGETTRTIPLTITDDNRREAGESIVVSMTPQGPGTLMGTPTRMTVIIRPSDQRPDGQISTSPSTGYAGNNVYNTTGERQTRTRSATRGQTRTFYARIYNDGNVRNVFALTGTRPPRGAKVRYLLGGKDVTAAMRSEAGVRLAVAPDRSGLVTVRIEVGPRAAIGTRKHALVTATWHGDSSRADTVRAVAKVVRR